MTGLMRIAETTDKIDIPHSEEKEAEMITVLLKRGGGNTIDRKVLMIIVGIHRIVRA